MSITLCVILSCVCLGPAVAAAQADVPQSPLPSLTVNGAELRDLKGPGPTDFTDCTREMGGISECAFRHDAKLHALLEQCENQDHHSPPGLAIAACNSAMDLGLAFGHAQSIMLANRAAAYWAGGDAESALRDYTRAIALRPKDPQLYFNRGLLEALNHEVAAAMDDYNRALSINPHLTTALVQRAKLFIAEHDLDPALEDCTQAVAQQPKSALLWSERGYVRLLRHEYTSALADEAHAVSLDRGLASGYYYRSIAYDGLYEHERASADLAVAMRLDPRLSRPSP